jgi:hypothetical protein
MIGFCVQIVVLGVRLTLNGRHLKSDETIPLAEKEGISALLAC